MSEKWLPIAGFDGYEVSNLGRVRSVARKVPWNGFLRTVHERVLAQWSNRSGYLVVEMRRNDDRKKTSRKVHQLVLESFIGPRPTGLVACHNNDVRTDNCLANLRWDTPAANIRDAVVNGVHGQSKKTVCKWGHPYTLENTYFRRDGRTCRTCQAERERKYKAKKAAA